MANDSALVYSYYWPGFLSGGSVLPGPRSVFQVHPIAAQVRRELFRDREISGIELGMEAEELLSHTDVVQESQDLSEADGYLCASSFVRAGLVGAGIDAEQVHVVPYGADRLPTRAGPPSQLPTGSDLGQIKLLWVGQLAYRKGPHWLMAAIKQFPPHRVKLTLVSRTQVPSWLSPLPPNVEIVPGASARQLRDLYQSHDLLAMPSLIEGFGLVYLEALSQGLPILSTPNSGAPDISTHGLDAWIVPTGSSDDIAAFLDRLLTDKDLLQSLRNGVAKCARPDWASFREGVNRALSSIEASFDAGANW